MDDATPIDWDVVALADLKASFVEAETVGADFLEFRGQVFPAPYAAHLIQVLDWHFERVFKTETLQ